MRDKEVGGKKGKSRKKAGGAAGKGRAKSTGGARRRLSEETRAKLEGLQGTLSDLQEDLLLTDIRGEMGEIESSLSLLPGKVEELRKRGYVFRSFLENKLEVLAEQWQEMEERVADEIEDRQRDLEREADAAERALEQASSGVARQVSRAESAIETLESKSQAAHSAIRAMYESLRENANQTQRQIEKIDWTLDQIDEATFQIHPAEDPVMACEAQYLETEKDGPEGVLYLTDERLVFEQKEEVATKKVLFITTAKEKVQEPIFEVSVGNIDEAKSSQKGFLGHKEIMELLFAPEADLSEARLRLLGGADNEEWAALIGRVKSGEIAKERTKPKDEEAIEAAREVPTKCPTCGATLSVEVVRGMREIKCEYCGSVIRL